MKPLELAKVGGPLASAPPGSLIYLVGAGGCGMSGLGHLLLDLGHRVAGSDLIRNEDVRQLTARGALIHQGHHAENLLAAQPILVVHSSAVPPDNPELSAARQAGLPVVRRGVLLAALVNRQPGICVAGMHGKTTTTALLAYVLDELGASPSYAIGGAVPQLPRSARWTPPPAPNQAAAASSLCPGAARWFVVETDESDGTLAEFRPRHAIILNVDAEHLDYFADLEAIDAAFAQFGRQTADRLIYCADDERLRRLFADRPRAHSFGRHPQAEYRLAQPPGEPAPGDEGRFELWHQDQRLGEFRLQLLGEKNSSNAAAVIALLHQLGVDPAALAQPLQTFRGVARRQQELFRDVRWRVFEDYGHHPREIQATLAALKGLGPRRLLVAFQPHRFTRTQHLLGQFATCFRGADRLWVTEVYAASEPPMVGVNGAVLAGAVQAAGQAAEFVADPEALKGALQAALAPGDMVLFLGAGNISQIAHRFVAELRAETVRHSAALWQELDGRLSAETVIKRDEPLAKHTTWRVGGQADCFIEPASEGDLAGLLQFCAAHQLPIHLLGRGSNLLVLDGGIRGVVICLGHANFSKIEIDGACLRCGAGAKLRDVAQAARRCGLGGLEFLEGIPGSVGGALRMNAGAMGGSFFEVVQRVRLMDFGGQVRELDRPEVPVQYRHCALFDDHIALAAVVQGQPAPREVIEQKLNQFNQKRWRSQPAAPSAGCVFKNPGTIPAGKLIEELGLKGLRVGGAAISDVHANFIVNDKHATAGDILRLIDIVKRRAWNTRHIALETEVEIVGEPGL